MKRRPFAGRRDCRGLALQDCVDHREEKAKERWSRRPVSVQIHLLKRRFVEAFAGPVAL